MIKNYVKTRPISVEAMQWDGTNTKQVKAFVDWMDVMENQDPRRLVLVSDLLLGVNLYDYIIKEWNGNILVINPDEFETSYDEV